MSEETDILKGLTPEERIERVKEMNDKAIPISEHPLRNEILELLESGEIVFS